MVRFKGREPEAELIGGPYLRGALEVSLVDVTSLLRILAEEGGSDLHLKVGAPPTIRVDGLLRRLPGNRLTGADTTTAAHEILPADRREKLERQNEAVFAYSVPGVGRFRVNVFRQRGSISLVFRWVRVGSPGFEDLGLPPVVRQLADAPRGLILVIGATGSGKTTTLAAFVDYINSRKPVHILTIEDPIEVVHTDRWQPSTARAGGRHRRLLGGYARGDAAGPGRHPDR